MLTYAYIQISAATGWHSSMRCGYQVIDTHPATHRCPIYTILNICPRATIYYILTTTCVLILLILLYVCPDATVYVSSSLMPYALCLMPHAACLRWNTCGVNDFMSSFAGMHQEEFLARMVLSLLALLVQQYKY
jgi:hypothetical protein